MCWSVEVSAASAAIGWATCAFLCWRQRPRDLFYARYLVTFTFTQLVDIALWTLNQQGDGLKACVDLQQQFGSFPREGGGVDGGEKQELNFLLTKFVLPIVVFSQHATQCTYPSKALSGQRRNLILAHLIPVVGMSFAFACSDTIAAKFPAAHQTMRWGGNFDEWPFALIQTAAVLHSGIVMLVSCKHRCLCHKTLLNPLMSAGLLDADEGAPAHFGCPPAAAVGRHVHAADH